MEGPWHMRGKNFWLTLVFLLAGVVLGGFIGDAAQGIPGLSWLNFGQSFGIKDPMVLDLGILTITFGCSIRITMAGILGMAAALFASRYV